MNNISIVHILYILTQDNLSIPFRPCALSLINVTKVFNRAMLIDDTEINDIFIIY